MKVYVETPARLHLGLIDLGGELGRIFGSIGVAIGHPGVALEAHPAESLTISGEKRDKVRSLVERFVEFYRVEPKVHINVLQSIPQHVGLGSETQLSLAVATALANLLRMKVSVRELASAMGRGSISGVGTAIFEHGGFVVDGGHKVEKCASAGLAALKEPPPIIFRHPFNEDWLFVVAIPNVKRGLAEDEEERVFRHLLPMSSEDVGKICRLVLMRMLPSLMERDLEGFGKALTQVQDAVGDYFREVQRGRYSSSTAKECIEYMLKMGAYGVGQSSWGPAVYGLVYGKNEAERLKQLIKGFLMERVGGQVFYTRADNNGASVRIIED